MEIKGFQEISFLDWPGKNAAIIFLNLCNLRCRYCHNADLARGLNAQSIPPSYVLARLHERRNWIDGLVISGGEPTLNRDLPSFLEDVRSFLPIKIKLDTNGTNPHLLEILLKEKLVDRVSIDIKAPFDTRIYSHICQANIDVTKIEKSVNLICDSHVECEFRTTVCSTLLSENDVVEVARELSCICGIVKEYTIQNFNPAHALDESLRRTMPYKVELLQKLGIRIQRDSNCNIIKCTVK